MQSNNLLLFFPHCIFLCVFEFVRFFLSKGGTLVVGSNYKARIRCSISPFVFPKCTFIMTETRNTFQIVVDAYVVVSRGIL